MRRFRALNVQLLYHGIAARKLNNAAGGVAEGAWIKE